MNNPMQDMMAEATRLMQEGRLSDATAAIQRALGGGSTPSFGQPFGQTFASSFAPPMEGFGGFGGSKEAAGEIIDVPLRPATEVPDAHRAERTFRRGSDPGLAGLFRRATGKGTRTAAPKPGVVPAGGRFVERSFTNAAGTRAYKLYVPSGYTGQEDVPLVVMLHGCTQDPDDFAAGTRMNAQAEGHTFLVAYPQQGGGSNMQKCWNWFKDGDQHRDHGEPSIIAGITREVLGEYKVAPDRVYVAGMSAGGAMAAIMGSTYPDLYAAVGVHSGLAPGAAHDLPSALSAMNGGMGPMGAAPRAHARAKSTGRTVPLVVFHGDRDSTVHPRNAEAVISHYRSSNSNGKADPIKVRQGQVPGGYSYTKSTQEDADGRPIAEYWRVHGLGHAWSGGGSPGSYVDPKGPDASAEMARFFDEHRLQN